VIAISPDLTSKRKLSGPEVRFEEISSKPVYVPSGGIVGGKVCSRQLSVALSGRLRCGLIP